MKVPWIWTRDKLAQAFNIRPWEVDSLPWHEIEVKLQLMALENEGRSRRERKKFEQDQRQGKKSAGHKRPPIRRKRR